MIAAHPVETLGDVSALAGVLAELSRATSKRFDANSFASRLRIQKSIYLLMNLGFKGMTEYGFSYYVRGPYSSELARDYYALKAGGVIPRRVCIPNEMIETVRRCLDRGDDFLEAVATLHSISRIRNSDERTEVIGVARSMKPDLSNTYDEAWDFVKAVGLL